MQHAGPFWQRLCGLDFPRLSSTRDSANAEEDVVIDLPEYDLRRLAAARDPLAVIEAHRLNVCFRLAWLLGLRMCPHCPRCNDRGSWGCQDLFGSNMRPTGGILGGAVALEGGNENQTVGTPHFHGQVHLVCMYQFATMAEIAARIKEGLAATKDIKTFQEWYHVEWPLDEQAHDAYEERAEQEFYDRLQDPEHNPLCQTPAFLQEDAAAASQDVQTLSQISYGNEEVPPVMLPILPSDVDHDRSRSAIGTEGQTTSHRQRPARAKRNMQTNA